MEEAMWSKKLIGNNPSLMQFISAPESIRAVISCEKVLVVKVILLYHFWNVFSKIEPQKLSILAKVVSWIVCSKNSTCIFKVLTRWVRVDTSFF